MFNFIRKEQFWSALDAGCLNEMGDRSSYELKVVQDVVVYSLLRNSRGLAITELGGGESRLLRRLSEEIDVITSKSSRARMAARKRSDAAERAKFEDICRRMEPCLKG